MIDQADRNAQSAFDNQAQADYAASLKNVTQNYMDLAHAAAQNTVTTMNLTDYFFARKAEWGAKALYDYQTANGLSHTYNADYVLSESMVSNGTTAFLWQTATQYTAILRGVSALSQSFVGTYDGMEWGFVSYADGQPIHAEAVSTYDTNAYLQVVLTMQIDTAAGKYVYIPAQSNIILANYAPTAEDSTVIVSSPTGEVYNESLSFTANEIKVITLADFGGKSGRYNIASSNAKIITFGEAAPDIANSGGCYPAVVSYTKSGENAVFVNAGTQKGTNGMMYGNVKMTTDPFTEHETWESYDTSYVYFGNDDESKYMVYLSQALSDLNAVMIKTKTLISTANAFGQSYFNLLVATNGEGNPPAPDIIFPDPNQMEGMSAEQVYAIYMAYLSQMKAWFYNYTAMDPGDITLSGGSLDLLCRGAIYDENGVMLYDNQTIFTPYVSISDWTITTGENNTMTQPAFIMVWGRSDTLEGYTTSTNMSYVATKAGYNLSVEEMYYRGVPVTEQELIVTTVDLVIADITGQITPPQGITDLSWLINHWFWFAIALGAIFLGGGAFTRNWIFALIGLLLVLAGLAGWVFYDSANAGGLLSGLLKGIKLW